MNKNIESAEQQSPQQVNCKRTSKNLALLNRWAAMAGHREQGAAPAPGSDGSTEEAAMDSYLRAHGLYRKKIAKDGSCLFRAVAEQILHSQASHLEIRRSCIQYLSDNRAHFESFFAARA
ncbi:unnamed protein product [Ranitomeya imitator]|uniref:ubiquitinyl hydrolase 1 n=1 Tax=Ranitomeya imitator TaxID=111125 RepID=A0ABN9KZZ5_9NEOB|nr:unnamed protein product [Ranitomeya imitator]